MNDRNAAGRILGILGVSASVALAAGCASKADDINTVQPGYVKKAIFQSGDEWHYRRTIVKSETTNALAIEGSGDIPLDRVKFRIDENVLIAYKPYEAVPGSQDQEVPGKGEFEGPVLAAWPISSHFDIVRSYDPATGNVTNVIGENQSDRPWYAREYMRIDWAHNLVESSMNAGWGIYEFVYYPFDDADGTVLDHSTGSYWTNLDTSPTDPFASRFTDDYIEVTNNVLLGMDIWTCATFTGFSGDAYSHCGYGEAKIRSSFVRVAEKSDFIPRDYPDSIVKKDADGKVIYDDVTGEVAREPLMDRFGFFRIETPTYDRGYGTTESGRLFRAMIHNIWVNHRDANGNRLPYSQRTPKPIIYHLNAEYPARWLQAAFEVGQDYDGVFKRMTADLQCRNETTGELDSGCYQGKMSSLPAMFEIRQNDCNVDNVKKFVSQNADLEFAVARAVCPSGSACDAPMNKIGVGNLEKVCTSLEAATRDPVTGKPAFEWQRVGDARTKMVVWLSNPQDSGWGGYGPMHADARTGETVSATAFLRGYSYEVGASTVVDYIELMNGQLSVEDTIYGQTIRQQVTQTLKRSKDLAVATAGQGLLDRIAGRMEVLGRNKNERLKEIDPNAQINRLLRIEDTRIEDALITDEDLALAGLGRWQPGETVTDELRDLASPIGRVTKQDIFSSARDKVRRTLTEAGFCFLNMDFDPHYAGLAMALQGKSHEEAYRFVAHRLIKHVMAHELGHNVGLAHNFEGSYDAINYGDEFWRLNWATEAEKVAGSYDEHRNTTVMEYMSMKGLFTDKLGKYDEAALRFGYGNQVQVFNKVTVPGGFDLKAQRLLMDYKESLPNYLCGGVCSTPEEALSYITDRSWTYFNPQSPPVNEVPYQFCDNTYDRRTPFCATFDFGSNLREIHANYYNMWSAYFFFNNFIRNRIVPAAWDPFRALLPATYAMINTNIVNQYLYYFQALDPDFVRTELGQDMAVTVAQGLNMASEIISTPEPVRMCEWQGSSPTIYLPYYYFSTGCDEYVPLDSEYAINANMIQPPLGPSRPASLGFTDDFVDYDISFVGSYFDKDRVMWLLGLNRPVLYRYNYALDLRSYQTSVYRLFEPEIRTFLDRLVSLDPYLATQTAAEELGSYWCRDPNNPNVPQMGHFLARDMIDPQTGATWPSAPTQPCEQASLMYPVLLRNTPFSAMFYAHWLYSSDFDSELDLGKSIRVYVAGADDEPTAFRNLPADQICELTDFLTSLSYRAVRQPAGVPDIACTLIDRARDAQVDYQNDRANDYMKERWRSWFERLEWARDLTRIYNP